MNADANAINWFEIPAIELERAKDFYEGIFKINMDFMDNGEMKMYVFPMDPSSGKVSGGIAASEFHEPAQSGGPLLYLNANPSIDLVLKRIEENGGKILIPKTRISEDVGFMAFFRDSEGNTIGLHANG